MKEEFLRSILCSSYYKTPESEFIEKYLNNPKFSNLLTKKIDHQDLSEIKTLLKEYYDAIADECSFDRALNELYYYPNHSFAKYVECYCNFDCDCFNADAVKQFEKKQEEACKEIKTQMQQYRKAKQHLSKVEKQFEELIKQLSEPNLEEENMKIAS